MDGKWVYYQQVLGVSSTYTRRRHFPPWISIVGFRERRLFAEQLVITELVPLFSKCFSHPIQSYLLSSSPFFLLLPPSYRIHDGVYHTPLGRLSTLDCSKTKRGANTERYVFGKLSARWFQHRFFWHRHSSNIPTVGISTMENRPRGVS